MKRRDFLAVAAVSPAAALPALAQPAHPACLPGYASIKTRPASKIEILYKTKHGQPNGLALASTPGQMWVQLPHDSPVIHCAKLVGDHMYFCDDMGWMCRFKI